MAIARVEATCKVCGELFTVRKDCRNRRDADSFELWGKDNIDTCSKCMEAQAMSLNKKNFIQLLDKFNMSLKEIIGVSDKQVDYAVSVREKYLCSHLPQVEKFLSVSANMKAKHSEFVNYCVERGLDPEEEISKGYKAYGLSVIRTMLESDSAKEILATDRRF